MAKKNQVNPSQIVRKDAAGAFVEAMRECYQIGKVRLNFSAYDSSKAPGHRQKAFISIYLDFGEFFRLSNDMINGKIYGEILKTKNTKDATKNLHMGGSYNKSGQLIARTLGVFAGKKAPFVFTAEQGPGKKNQMGGYVPAWNGQPHDTVNVALSVDAVKELFLFVEKDIQAYLAFKQMLPYQLYANELIEAMAIKQGVNIAPAKEKFEAAIPSRRKDEQGSEETSYAYGDEPPAGYNGPYTPAPQNPNVNSAPQQGGYNGGNASSPPVRNNPNNIQDSYGQQNPTYSSPDGYMNRGRQGYEQRNEQAVGGYNNPYMFNRVG